MIMQYVKIQLPVSKQCIQCILMPNRPKQAMHRSSLPLGEVAAREVKAPEAEVYEAIFTLRLKTPV